MSTLKELNGRLTTQSYVSGFSPSKEDARIFDEMFGDKVHVAQWAARMASYYQSEREAMLKSEEKPKAEAGSSSAHHNEAHKKKDKTEEKKEKHEDKSAAAAEDDDIDLFGETTEEEKAALEAKKAADAAKKKEKKGGPAKSSILFDIKAWDDTVDLEALAAKLHAIERDGLTWGQHKLAPVAFGVNKLQQLVIIEDDKVSGDDLEDIIMGFEDEVQSIDIVAWNKV